MQHQLVRQLTNARSLLIIGLFATMIFVACSSDDQPMQAPTTAQTSQQHATLSVSTLSGEIVIDGSSTVYPVTVAAAEDFRKLHPEVQIPVGISGTGGGFKKFTAGETVDLRRFSTDQRLRARISCLRTALRSLS